MASIIKRKIKGVTYVYEQTATYDAEKRQTVRKQVLIGKLDEATGEIVPTRKKQIRTITTTTIFDTNDLKNEIIQKIEPLKESNPEKYKEAVELVKKIPEQKPETSTLGLYQADQLSVMFSGKLTGTLGKLQTVGVIDPIRKSAHVDGVKIISQNISNIGVGEAKIFRYAIAAFTKVNSRGTSSTQLRLRVFLSLNNYAQITGTDISSESGLKNFKKKLKKNLENLLQKNITFSWSEDIKCKTKNFGGISLISGYSVKGETITIDFSLGLAEYLVSLPTLIEFPRSLYKVNDRFSNAYAIGEALFRHYSINNNIIRNTEHMFSIIKLLEVTSFPSAEKIKIKKWSWEYKVKEPFEKALDKLCRCGLIKDWCYSQAKGKKLSDKEAAQITSYEIFVSLYIWYELNEYPEHKERADTIIEAKAKSIEKIKRRKTKNS